MRPERKAVEHYLAALRVQDIVSGEEGRTESGNPRWAERVYIRESRAGVDIVLCARKPLPTVSIEIARGEPARDGEIEHDVPETGLFSVLVTFIAELYCRFRDQFLGYGAETGSRIGCFLCDEFSLSLECDDE